MTLADISNNLAATCEKLASLLDNAAFKALMHADLDECEQLEEDRDRLEDAVYRNDRDTMTELIAKYNEIVKRMQ